MKDRDQQERRRDGKAATSNGDQIEPLPTPTIPLGDINDLRAFVHKIARTITDDEDELEELIDEGIALAWKREKERGPRESLQQTLAGWLESRLRDHWRTQHREWRRNSRAGTTYGLPTPTGLAWEHSATTAGIPLADEAAIIQSRLRLELFKSEDDLRNPRLIGRFLGVPSHAGLPTGRSQDIWATHTQERALTGPEPFRFHKLPD
jgi:DNA-directed RNA polymerase specialized sigma24 family protein